jgi:hypothetical protein
MEAFWSYRHRPVTETDVAFIRQLMEENPGASRRQLSQKLCQAWNWVQPNGALRDMVCRGLMLQLHRQGRIQLPPVRRMVRNPLVERSRPVRIEVDSTAVKASLAQVRPLEFRPVRRTPEEALFNSLIEQYHYLKYTQPVGEQVKFLVYAQGRPLACLAWSSSPRHLASRDRFLGWSAAARRNNIRLLAYNCRFLLLPWVQVEHLASHILGRMAKILPQEWLRLYGHPVYFLETFVDPQRFRGTCYRAANWICLGRTTGRGKASNSYRPNRPIKEVWGYPLTPHFRQLLGGGLG